MSPNGRNCRPNRPLCAKPCGWRRGWADSWDAKATANPGRRLFGLDCNALMIWPGCTWYCAVANDRRCPAIEDMGNDQLPMGEGWGEGRVALGRNTPSE